MSYLDYLDYSRESRAFQSMAVTLPINPILTGRGDPERVIGAQVSPTYFDLFMVQPAVGRGFSKSESDERVVLSATGSGSAVSAEAPRRSGSRWSWITSLTRSSA